MFLPAGCVIFLFSSFLFLFFFFLVVIVVVVVVSSSYHLLQFSSSFSSLSRSLVCIIVINVYDVKSERRGSDRGCDQFYSLRCLSQSCTVCKHSFDFLSYHFTRFFLFIQFSFILFFFLILFLYSSLSFIYVILFVLFFSYIFVKKRRRRGRTISQKKKLNRKVVFDRDKDEVRKDCYQNGGYEEK